MDHFIGDDNPPEVEEHSWKCSVWPSGFPVRTLVIWQLQKFQSTSMWPKLIFTNYVPRFLWACQSKNVYTKLYPGIRLPFLWNLSKKNENFYMMFILKIKVFGETKPIKKINWKDNHFYWWKKNVASLVKPWENEQLILQFFDRLFENVYYSFGLWFLNQIFF